MKRKRKYNAHIRYSELRQDSDKTQSDIALILKVNGVNGNTYLKWEKCINDMPIEKCVELANYYNTSLDYLLGLSNIHKNIQEKRIINYQLLSQRLLQLRKEANLSQQVLGDKLGFMQRTYANYESGKRIPTVLKLLTVAQFYNVSFDYLVGCIDDKEIR